MQRLTIDDLVRSKNKDRPTPPLGGKVVTFRRSEWLDGETVKRIAKTLSERHMRDDPSLSCHTLWFKHEQRRRWRKLVPRTERSTVIEITYEVIPEE